jgi:hypothetical protein
MDPLGVMALIGNLGEQVERMVEDQHEVERW